MQQKQRIILAAVLFATVFTLVAEAQERRGRGEGRRGGGEWITRMTDRLQLDDAQRSEFDALVEPYRAQWQADRSAWREHRGAIREAEANGDSALVEELRANRPQRTSNPMSDMQQVLTDLAPSLDAEQQVTLKEMQAGIAERAQRAEQWRKRREMVRALPDAVGMDDDQRAAFDEQVRSMRDDMRSQWRELRPLRNEMRAAREAGDNELADAIRDEMRAAGPDMDAMAERFDSDVRSLLSDDQLKQYEAFRDQHADVFNVNGGANGNDAAGQARLAAQQKDERPTDARNVVRAVRRVTLDVEQRDQVREIEREMMMEMRTLRRTDREAQKQLAVQIQTKISAVLDAEQKVVFEAALQQIDQRRSR